MPILPKEQDLYPLDLFDHESLGEEEDKSWWAIYTMSRREKDLMRRLVKMNIPFYGPVIPHITKSPKGRERTSYIPLFSNYVFVYSDEAQRVQVLSTNCVSQSIKVTEGKQLTQDLKQIYQLIKTGLPLARIDNLQPGTKVKVISGSMTGYEGLITEIRGKNRLIITVNFLQQGVSVELDNCEVEKL